MSEGALRSAALAVAFVLIWGSAFNAARVVVLEWPPFWALALRFLLTAPPLRLPGAVGSPATPVATV